MKSLRYPLTALLLASGIAGGSLAFAQTQVPAPGAAPAGPAVERLSPSTRVEGHIASLRAMLKITDAQAPQFEVLAKVMRDQAAAMQAARPAPGTPRPAQPVSAVERLEARSAMHKRMIVGQDAYLNALKPLYASLSAEQKTTADQLFGKRGGPRHHGPKGGPRP